MTMKMGYVRIDGERLSEFHRLLVRTIPKYASIAVSEGALPADRSVLTIEERAMLPPPESEGTSPRSNDDDDEDPSLLLGTTRRVRDENRDTSICYGHLADYLAKHVAKSINGISGGREPSEQARKPEPQEKQPLQPRDLYSPVFKKKGVAGEQVRFDWKPGCYFRAEYVHVSDTLDGCGTEISYLSVGHRPQMRSPIPTVYVIRNSGRLDRIIDTCQPESQICMTVKFLKDCEFSVWYAGKAVLG